jgi:MFS transporter, ACS family, aldohexuronate transporter
MSDPTSAGQQSASTKGNPPVPAGLAANLFTFPSDVFPCRTIATVVGIGGFGGATCAAFIAILTGFLLQFTGSYPGILIIAGSAYLVSVLIMHMLMPRFKPVAVSQKNGD